ncbi:MAG TPA: Fe-S cluster assembly protein SufD [Actinomycetota bacterium]|nr:Fe-S cluster assembly protein SufD [Actinomycetota bacterium]
MTATTTYTDPQWVSDLRRRAAEARDQAVYPSGREEHWRFTDVSLLRPELYDATPAESDRTTTPGKATSALELSGLQSAGRAIHTDASLAELTLSDEAMSKGVVFKPLGEAVQTHADVLEPRLGSLVGASDTFTSWSLADWRGGMFLYVPRGVSLTDPIQALHWIDAAGTVVQPRTVVVVEEDARVVFNDLYASNDLDRPTLAMPTVELFVGRGANVGWVTWQDWGSGVRHLAHVKAQLDRDATLNTLLVTLGGDFSRTTKECVLAGEGAESYMYGLYFPHGEQRFEHWTVQDHASPNTTSDLLYKGALTDTSQAVYYGTIVVRPGSAKTNAYQANRNLTLSPRARALTNPQLEIQNNDVRCTHGATVGQIDEDHLFYIQSRGVPRDEAERLVVFGFFNEVLERVTWSGMHERLAEAIRHKMLGADL